MTQEKLNEILELHKKWLNGDKGGKMADLTDVDLTGANLNGANLRGAKLKRTNLQGASLFGVNLMGSNLDNANLQGAYLFCANLKYTNLRGANLSNAFMRKADMTRASLTEADLASADLGNANLSDAFIQNANLTGADLVGADLAGASLIGTVLTDIKYDAKTSFLVLQCPEEGAFVAYKYVNGIIVKLGVPEDAERSSATTRKCRCSKALVLGFYDLNKNELNINEVVNSRYVETIYRKGEMVYPDKWDANRWKECSHGIHFFMTFHEAKNYPIL